MRTRIKFCGITRSEDAQAAVALGVDAIGLVLTRRSPRCVGIGAARAIRDSLPAFVTVVALFMDDDAAWIDEAIMGVRPDLLQFHGSEGADFASGFGRPYMKAVPMGCGADAAVLAALHPAAVGLLLDSHASGTGGGTGVPFDWSLVPKIAQPVVLAGGLDAENVATAIALVRPYAVDVSSGIEIAPGHKDPAKMRAFAAAVRRADVATTAGTR